MSDLGSDSGSDDGMARLTARAAEGAARARASGRRVVVSVVERIAMVDPLAAVMRFVSPGDASHMYWARPAERFALAGIGAAATLAAQGAERYATVEREWGALLEGALVDDASGAAAGVAAGTGPLLMGGFSFEPEGPRTARWRGFGGAQFTLPRFLLAALGNDCWLTTTIVVGADGLPDATLGEVAAARKRIVGITERADDETIRAEHEATVPYADLLPAADWRARVELAVEAIGAGAFEKVVLARAVRAVSDTTDASDTTATFDVEATVRQLRSAHHDAFVFACWRGDRAFVGASPERLVRLDAREVLASSLAGSAERGASPDEDAWLAARLLASAKDAGEHAVVLRALRDGLGEICDDVTAADEPSLLTLRHVHHLHTVVRARLRAGHSLLELVGRLHPTPAVGGAPREAALAFIRAHEGLDRGWYAAPVGWLQGDHGEFAVALRSALVEGREATLFAGCGVVRESDPELEYAESVVKLRPMAAALAAAQGSSHSSQIAESAEREVARLR